MGGQRVTSHPLRTEQWHVASKVGAALVAFGTVGRTELSQELLVFPAMAQF